MTITAVVPVKGLGNVKQRLSTRLGRDERAAVVLRLLARELDVLGSIARIEHVIVVTSGERVKALAEMKRAVVALQPDSGVNAAIGTGIEQAYASGADVVLALHGDLPFISAPDVKALIEASEQGVFVIAPDRKRIGTNAIVVRRSTPVELNFGIGSYARHVAAARSAGVAIREVETSGLGFDLDTPADLLEYRRRQRHGENGATLDRYRIADDAAG